MGGGAADDARRPREDPQRPLSREGRFDDAQQREMPGMRDGAAVAGRRVRVPDLWADGDRFDRIVMSALPVILSAGGRTGPMGTARDTPRTTTSSPPAHRRVDVGQSADHARSERVRPAADHVGRGRKPPVWAWNLLARWTSDPHPLLRAGIQRPHRDRRVRGERRAPLRCGVAERSDSALPRASKRGRSFRFAPSLSIRSSRAECASRPAVACPRSGPMCVASTTRR